MSLSPAEGAARIKAEAAALGFDACGIATVDGPVDPEDRLGTWLAQGFHADMAWMATTRALRQDVRLKLPGARSMIVVARNYYQTSPEPEPGTGKVARYAWGRDYHKVLRKPLIALAHTLEAMDPQALSYIAVDSGPVMERSWAERAGLGWIGKNGLVLRRDLGSWFLLGCLSTTLELAADPPQSNHCGSCTACLDACPTEAFTAPMVLDARRCIAYHTIENRAEIPSELGSRFDGWVFGCDVCQEVCPWNRFATPTSEPGFAAREGVPQPNLADLLSIDEAAFDRQFQGTPVRRAKHAGMVRNARLAAANRDHRQD